MCKKANLFYLILFVSTIAASFAIVFILGDTELPLWVEMIETYAFMLVPVVLFLCIANINPARKFPWRVLKPLDVVLSLLFGYMLLPLVIFLNYISMFLVENHLQDTTTELYTTYPFLMQLLLMAVIPAVVEEFIFRGIFYHSYRKNGVLGAAVLSGLGFGLFHMNFNQFLYAFVLGIVLALLVEATSSLYSSMLAHFAINSYSLIVMNLMPEEMLEESESALENQALSGAEMTAANVMAGIMLAVMAIGFGAVAVAIYKKLAKRNNRYRYMQIKMKQGLHAVNGERFVTVPMVIAIIAGVAVMVLVM